MRNVGRRFRRSINEKSRKNAAASIATISVEKSSYPQDANTVVGSGSKLPTRRNTPIWLAPMPTPGIDVQALRRATWEERTIHFAYTDVEGRETEREVDPLSIVFMQASHNLLAYCHLRKDFRAFRLDRMSNLAETGASFRPRRVPLLREYMARMRTERESYHPA